MQQEQRIDLKANMSEDKGSSDSLGQPQQARNESGNRMSLTSLRQKAIQQLELATLKNAPGYRAISPSESVSPSPILSKMPIGDNKVTDEVATSPTGLSHLTSARPAKPKAQRPATKPVISDIAKVEEPKVAVVEFANAQQEVKISSVQEIHEKSVEPKVEQAAPQKKIMGFALPGIQSANAGTLKKNAFIQQDKKPVEKPADEPEFLKFRRGLKSVSSSAPASAAVEPIKAVDTPLSAPVRASESKVMTKEVTGSRNSLYQAPPVANGSVHDLTQQLSKLKSVQSTSKTSLENKDQAAQELATLRNQLKATAVGSSQTLNKDTKVVPEFLAMRNKIRQPGQDGSNADLTTPKANSGNYNRYGGAQKSPLKTSALNTYVAPKVLPGDGRAQTVNLKGVKGDSFLSVTGGSTRPTEPLLLVVKGKKKISASRVQTSTSVLNQTDALILDVAVQGSSGKEDPEKPAMRNLFVCSGEKTSKVRRTKAIEMANLIKDSDYSGKADIILVELGNIKERLIPDKEMQFWQVLFGNPSVSRSLIQQTVGAAPVESVDDAEYEKKTDDTLVAYQFNNGQAAQLINNGKQLKYALLQTDQVIIVDCQSEMYVWAGKAAKEDQKLSAWAWVQQKAKDRNLPLSSTFKEGERFERVMFKSKFEDWPVGDNLRTHNVLEVKQAGNIQAKDKAWRVYDRGSDIKKVDKVDIVRMYDKNSAPELSVAKNSEAMDIDPAEIVKKDWGFGRMRIWAQTNSGISDSTKSVQTVFDAAVMQKMERKFDKEHPFLFKSNECYVFLYEYKEKPAKMMDQVLVERTKLVKEELIASMKQNAVLYVWSGDQSSVQDQAILAHFVVELEKMQRDGRLQVAAKAKHVRISEGKEPVHFLNAIRGGNIPRQQPQKILEMLPKADVPPSPVVAVVNGSSDGLFHVFGTYVDTTRVSQLESVTSNLLSSSASYVVKKGDVAHVWNGGGSFQWEQDAAVKFANMVSKKVEVVKEGQETDTFWSMFKNGKQVYDQKDFYKNRPQLPIQTGFTDVHGVSLTSSSMQTAQAPYDVRLWKINFFVNGNPTAQEIFPFSWKDLEEDCVYVMDSYFQLFVWIGGDVGRSKATQRNQVIKVPLEQQAGKSASSGFRDMRLAIETAINYVDYVGEREQDRLNRSKAYVVQSGAEPMDFVSQFVNWQKRQRIDQWPSNIGILQAYDMMFNQKYTLKELRKFAVDRDNLPFGLDLERLETYLSDSDFDATFQMSREKFGSQPQWKQTETKKRVQLF